MPFIVRSGVEFKMLRFQGHPDGFSTCFFLSITRDKCILEGAYHRDMAWWECFKSFTSTQLTGAAAWQCVRGSPFWRRRTRREREIDKIQGDIARVLVT